MKYEGKLYGKVAGKYIEVNNHISNDELLSNLNELIISCKERADLFSETGLETARIASEAMAVAYQTIVDMINNAKNEHHT